MKMKIISIVVSSIIFISSSIVGYNIYKDTESKKAESLKTETAQESATQTENDTEEKADKEELEENKIENQEEVKENKEETKDVQENKKDNTEKETSSGKITEKVNNNEKVSVSQNDQSKNNEQNTKTNVDNNVVDNKQNKEQNKSVSKFTVYRCGANVASKDDMFYNDEFGYPIGMVGSEDIWMYYIDFNLDKKTAETGNEVNGKKSVLTTIKLTDSQVEKLRKIYQGSGDSEIPSGIYYEVNSEEYEKDCRIVIVTNKSDIDFLNELVSKYWKESTIICK